MPAILKKSARRCLFGPPSAEQQDATAKWLAEKLERTYRESAEKWGFDFKLGVPLGEASTSSGFVYEIVSEAEVPHFYRTRHLSSSTSTGSLTSSEPSTSPKSVFNKYEEEMETESGDKMLNISSCSESDISMDFEPVPISKRASHTPKKRGAKLTDYIPIRRKKIQRSPKSPATSVATASSSVATSRRF